jgi:vacuolar-type H+-ATPase subunit C/Vma6
MTDTTCNGWTNYETWLANVWLGETGFQDDLASQRNLTLDDVAREIESMIEMMTEEAYEASHGLASDLMRAAISAINVNELARAYFSDLETEETL